MFFFTCALRYRYLRKETVPALKAAQIDPRCLPGDECFQRQWPGLERALLREMAEKNKGGQSMTSLGRSLREHVNPQEKNSFGFRFVVEKYLCEAVRTAIKVEKGCHASSYRSPHRGRRAMALSGVNWGASRAVCPCTASSCFGF